MLAGLLYAFGMEDPTRGLPERPARRAATIARVGARYGFGFVLGRRFLPRPRREEPGRVGTRLRGALEDLGPTYAELGRFLSTRRDLLPPDVAAELARTASPPRTLTFTEMRALVERELGNSLERLFLAFEETPVRTGTFTQAHGAVLPGGRPALVVVVRPGVRRDLLAMRPVADLTRRRLGDRLPLNPNEIVAEFSAHATLRRDMFFAARMAGRLRGLTDLRIPGVYRGYSSGRCATFEAPATPEPLTPEGYREVSRALVRLALTEGIFLSDTTPRRFATGDTTGELWILDPTEVLVLDPERLRGLAEVLSAMRRDDVDRLVRSLPLAGSDVPRDDAALRRELREALGSLGGPLWREHSLERVRNVGLEAVRRGEARLHVEVTQLAASLVAAETLGGERHPQIEEAAQAAQTLIDRYRDPAYVASRLTRNLLELDALAEFPRQVHSLLDELKDGEIEVSFRHAELDELISKVDILANRLVFALLIAALVIGSSMLGIFVDEGLKILGVSVFGFVGFVAAAILGLGLLVDIIRSGRL